MQVLLLVDVRGIGRRMEVKNVSDGYARNFLIARKLAVPATSESLAMKAGHDAKEQATLAHAKEVARQLENETIELSVKAGAHGAIFGSVTVKSIKEALAARGYKNVDLKLERPLKTVGTHDVGVSLGHGVSANVKVMLVGQQ